MPIDHSDAIYFLRQQLAAEITRALGGADSQFTLSAYYGIPQPRMSELSRGVVDRCTVEWLIRRLYRMEGTVAIRVEVGDVARAWRQRKFRERLMSKVESARSPK